MTDFIRSLCITISSALLKIIPTLYSMFHSLAAEPTLFNTAEIERLTGNIYTLISVVMLFAFATKAISIIVNPDNIWDSKKGITGVVKRSVIALVLLVGIPFGFKYFYEFQTQIINNNLIEKLILGIDYSDSTLTTEEQAKMEEEIKNAKSDTLKNYIRNKYKKSSASYLIGQNIAQKVLAATLHPTVADENGKCISDGTGVTLVNPVVHPIRTLYKGEFLEITDATTVCDIYNAAISQNIDYVTFLTDHINDIVGIDAGSLGDWASFFGISTAYKAYETLAEASGVKYYVLDYDYWGLLSVVASGAVVYLLVIFCIDCAVRLIKLAFLEITAPVSVMAYIIGGTDVLKKWWKELYTTAISFFLRVAAIAMIALVLINLDEFSKNIPGYFSDLTRVFIIIGTLIFAKKIPELIEKLLGVKITTQGGIGGRLGQMAGVGKIAQNAWKSLGKTARGVGTTALGLGLGGTVAAGKLGINKLDNSKFNGELLDKIKSNKAYQGISTFGKVTKAGISQGGGIGKTVKAMNEELNKSELVDEFKNKGAESKRLAQSKAAKERLDKLSLNPDGTAKDNPELNGISAYNEREVIKPDGTRKKEKTYRTETVNGKQSKIMASDINREISENEIKKENLNGLGNAIIDEGRANRVKRIIDETKAAYSKEKEVTDAIQKRAAETGNIELANEVNSLHTNLFNKKQFTEYLNKVSEMKDSGKITADEATTLRGQTRRVEGNLLNLESIIGNPEYNLENNGRIKAIVNDNLGGLMLGEAVAAAEKLTADASAIVESGIKGIENNTYLKSQITEQRDALKAINNQNISDNKQRMENNDTRYNDPNPPSPSPSSQNSQPTSSSTIILPGTKEYNEALQGGNNQSSMNNNQQGSSQNVNNNQQGTQANINGGTIHVDSIQADNISANTVSGNTFNAANVSGGFNPELQQDNGEQTGATRMNESDSSSNDNQKVVDALEKSTKQFKESIDETNENITSNTDAMNKNADKGLTVQKEMNKNIKNINDTSGSNPDNKE